MTLIKSISGIRGTIGGITDDNLTPLDIVKYTSAYGTWLKKNTQKTNISVVVGRDARISGEMVEQLVTGTLIGLGINVINLGLSTTPTVEIMVTEEAASGGIIITASHNPAQWNALKLLNHKGEFISDEDGKEILHIANHNLFSFSEVYNLGKITHHSHSIEKHVEKILKLPLVNIEAIKAAQFKVVVDAVNSTGGIAVPLLLEKLGVHCIKIHCTVNGDFPHNPEPLPEHLKDISEKVRLEKADLGIVVDPDVDRLAFISEDGTFFGEEYTLVSIADYILKNNPGNTVSNLSSTRALQDITEKNNGIYHSSAVGEVNVVKKMKEVNAVIGGEGNGGIIYPDLHYGRDALVGIALFLSHVATQKIKISQLKKTYPLYFISKNKIELNPTINTDLILKKMSDLYADKLKNNEDGLKIILNEKEWIHLRKSNTEPIIRIYSESTTEENANKLAEKFVQEIASINI